MLDLMQRAQPGEPSFYVTLIGRVTVRVGAKSFIPSTRGSRALIALALRLHSSKDELAAIVYGASLRGSEREQLAKALGDLRKQVGPEVLPKRALYFSRRPTTDLEEIEAVKDPADLAWLLQNGSEILPGLTAPQAEAARQRVRGEFEAAGRLLLRDPTLTDQERRQIIQDVRSVVPGFSAAPDIVTASANHDPRTAISDVLRSLDATPAGELRGALGSALAHDLLDAMRILRDASEDDRRFDRTTVDLAQDAVESLEAAGYSSAELRIGLARTYEGYHDFPAAHQQLLALAPTQMQAEALHWEGMVQMTVGDLGAADSLFSQAIDLTTDPVKRLELRMFRDVWLARYRRDPHGLVDQAESLERSPHFNDSPEQLRCSVSWQRGLGYVLLGKFDQGRHILEQTYKDSAVAPNSHRYRGLSEAALQAHDFQASDRYRETFHELARAASTPALLGHIHLVEARRLIGLSEHEPEPRKMLEKAIAEADMGLRQWAKTGSYSGAATGLIYQAQAHDRLGQHIAAYAHYHGAAALLEGVGYSQLWQYHLARTERERLRLTIHFDKDLVNAEGQAERLHRQAAALCGTPLMLAKR